MYARRLMCKNKKWDLLFQQSKFFISSNYRDHACSRSSSSATITGNCTSRGSLIRGHLSDSFSSRGVGPGNGHTRLHGRPNANWRSSQLRVFSSKGDGNKASNDKHAPEKDEAKFDEGKVQREDFKEGARHFDAHARLGEQEQKEWLNNEKLSIESKKKESPFLTKREKFKNEFLRRVVPWEKITVSWETFPYYIHEHTKKLLVECASSHLKHKKFTSSYGSRLTSSSGRILLQSVPGTELYRERLVRALARDLHVPLLVLDSTVLAPYDFGEDCSSESESDDENAESGEECSSESEVEDENDGNNEEEWTSSGETRSDCTDDDEVQVSAEALKKLVPYNLEDFEKRRVNWEVASYSCELSEEDLVRLKLSYDLGIIFLEFSAARMKRKAVVCSSKKVAKKLPGKASREEAAEVPSVEHWFRASYFGVGDRFWQQLEDKRTVNPSQVLLGVPEAEEGAEGMIAPESIMRLHIERGLYPYAFPAHDSYAFTKNGGGFDAWVEEALTDPSFKEVLKKAESVSGESESSSESSKVESVEPSDKPKRPLKKGGLGAPLALCTKKSVSIGGGGMVKLGVAAVVVVIGFILKVKAVLGGGWDRVKYIGPTLNAEAGNKIILGKITTSDGPTNAYTVIRGRSLPNGKRGEVYEVMGDRVALLLDISENSTDEGEKDEKPTGEAAEPLLYFVQVKNLEHDLDIQAEDCYVAMEALCEVLHSTQPIIVYFPDSSLWLSRAVSKSNRKEFVHKVQEMLDQLSGPLVLICGQNKVETGSKEKEKFTMILPNLGRLAKLPLPLKRLTEGLRGSTKRSEDNEIYKLFSNVMCLYPPKEDDVLRTFNKQVEEDRRIVISRSNINELHKVLEEHELSCLDLLHVNTDGVILTKRKAEKVVGWAKNHYLSSCLLPSIKAERLCVPRERLREQETISKKPSQNLKNLAKDEYESNFVSAVVPPGEIGVKFDDIGALEEVKRALNELVILPMRRPELFLHGNLLRPCKGILLFGPPGTGKTLLAKALATEAGANFISITGSTLTSKWFGDAEKLTKALFSFASKLSPVIVFVDEVDSLLGARGGSFEHEATRRMRNEFMAAWDGLRSKDSQRILILGATNRPFDLDDAVIRRLPRRIYVDLPDAENRVKILRIFLAKENLEPEFQFEKLANATEGYSGSDLKNLCIAAAYRPVQELLEEEKKVDKNDMVPVLRPLNLDDFIESKAKVGASVAYDATSMNELRKWNDQYGEGGSRRTSPFGF
ncbi:unnamed protein product [Camellia sinensis]